jgi:hypothetical protein
MIALDTMAKLATQQRHMDILEDMIFQLADQLKTMRLEHEEIMQQIVREERE